MSSAEKKSVGKRVPKKREYPKVTAGSKLARETREKANRLTEDERADCFNRGMQIIYGGNGTKKVRTGH